MNKQKSKYFSTAILMDEALISLLEKKEIDYITIKEICAKAGVNRSTFYLHYESINDLLDETMNYINQKFVDYFNENAREFIDKIQSSPLDELNLIKKHYLTPYLSFIKENKNIFRVSFHNPTRMNSLHRYQNLEKYIIHPILERYDIPREERKYLTAFYIRGISAIIEIWLKDYCKEDIEEIERMIMKCVGVKE